MEQKKLKFWDKPFGTVLLFLILYITANIFTVLYGLIFEFVYVEPKWLELLTTYLGVALMGLLFWIFMKVKDKESFKTMLPGFGNNNLKNVGLGLLAGLGANAGLGLLACASGCISVSFKGMNIGFAIIAFIFVALQCIGEEIMDRVFLFQRLARAKGPMFAIVISSIVFSAMHILNLIIYKVEPVYAAFALINIVLIGVFCCETIYFGNNVWFAFAFHTAWNYSQNYILGLPNSGNPSTESVFVLADAGRDNVFFYSTSFGVEATANTTIVIAILVVLTYVFGKKKMKKQ